MFETNNITITSVANGYVVTIPVVQSVENDVFYKSMQAAAGAMASKIGAVDTVQQIIQDNENKPDNDDTTNTLP